LDQALVDRAIEVFQTGTYDLVTNLFPRTWPPGQSVEVTATKAFRRAYAVMSRPEHFEHVTPYFYENHQDFIICNLDSRQQLREVRLSVDTKADLDVFARIGGRMDKPHWQYGLAEIVELYRQVTATAGSTVPA